MPVKMTFIFLIGEAELKSQGKNGQLLKINSGDRSSKKCAQRYPLDQSTKYSGLPLPPKLVSLILF
jgi:hypothetical protein